MYMYLYILMRWMFDMVRCAILKSDDGIQSYLVFKRKRHTNGVWIQIHCSLDLNVVTFGTVVLTLQSYLKNRLFNDLIIMLMLRVDEYINKVIVSVAFIRPCSICVPVCAIFLNAQHMVHYYYYCHWGLPVCLLACLPAILLSLKEFSIQKYIIFFMTDLYKCKYMASALTKL